MHRRRIARRLLLCLCLATGIVAAAGAGPGRSTDADTTDILQNGFIQPNLGHKLDSVLERFSSYGYSGVVLVGWGGLVALHRAYGMADRERETPNTVRTAFPIGPLTMQFTAAAILRLEMDGLLRTSDRIADYLGGFPGPKGEATIHDLLTHTAGLAAKDRDVLRSNRDEFVRAMKEAQIDFPPGTGHRVSPAGYILLAVLVEKVSGRSFEEYLQEKLFEPAGLRDTRFLDDPPRASSPLAVGYVGGRSLLPWLGRLPLPRLAVTLSGPLLRGRAAKLRPAPAKDYDWTVRGAGGVVTTVGDLFRWDLALRGEKILSGTARKKLLTASRGGQAYAWQVETTRRGTDRIHLGGRRGGFASEFVRYDRYLRYVEKDLVVILTVNNDMGWGRAVWATIEDVTYGEDYSTPFAVLAIVILFFVVGGATRRTKRKPRGRRRWRQYRPPPQSSHRAMFCDVFIPAVSNDPPTKRDPSNSARA